MTFMFVPGYSNSTILLVFQQKFKDGPSKRLHCARITFAKSSAGYTTFFTLCTNTFCPSSVHLCWTGCASLPLDFIRWLASFIGNHLICSGQRSKHLRMSWVFSISARYIQIQMFWGLVFSLVHPHPPFFKICVQLSYAQMQLGEVKALQNIFMLQNLLQEINININIVILINTHGLTSQNLLKPWGQFFRAEPPLNKVMQADRIQPIILSSS